MGCSVPGQCVVCAVGIVSISLLAHIYRPVGYVRWDGVLVGQQTAPYGEQVRMWGQESASLIAELRRPKMGAKRGDNTWHIEEDSNGRYLVFDRSR